ncbi:DNA-processing protein DprA [Aeromonas veronii]
MTPVLSPNTQAILLLTAPLIIGRATVSTDLLSPSEYKRLARHLWESQRQPADLLSPDSFSVIQECRTLIDESRLLRLLGRGFLLSQAIEHWQARAIWVVSRADATYPRRLKARLREDAPALLYGCGNIALLENGGLAVVGSRHIDSSLTEYSMSIGKLAANSGKMLISGGAKGVDLAAMQGALDAKGKVCGILGDSLEKAAMKRENRDQLLEGNLVLISPYDPNAKFNVGHAMQRNKLIYAFADRALIVNSDLNKGGTWVGAIEQLKKFRFTPIFVRSSGDFSPGLDALRAEGAMPWPNPQDPITFAMVFEKTPPAARPLLQNDLFSEEPENSTKSEGIECTSQCHEIEESITAHVKTDTTQLDEHHSFESVVTELHVELSPHENIFAAFRQELQKYMHEPMTPAAITTALGLEKTQVNVWLQRLVSEEVLEKLDRPVRYIIRQKQLL